mgnify:CR=1 FL=1
MERMSINRWVFLLVAALGALISGSANAAVAINDTYSFSTADESPLNVHVTDNDDVESDFRNVNLFVGQIFSGNAAVNVFHPSEGIPYLEVTPDAGFTTGTIEFNYTVADTNGSSEAFVSIEVTAGSSDKLLDDTYFVTGGNTVTFNVLSNDTISASEFSVNIDDSTLPAGVLTAGSGSGVFTFDATGLSAGTYVFTYTVDAVNGQTARVMVLVDSGTSPKSVINASSSSSTIAEGGSATITLTRTGSSQEAISIQVSRSVASTADASDFSLSQTTISWAAGDTANKTVSVSINEDTSVEPLESLFVTFTNTTGGAVYEGSDIAFSIAATDAVSFVQSTYTVSEDGGSVVVEVARFGTGSGAASVALLLNTGSSTATEGSDFTFTNLTTVNWASGEVGNKTVTIPITHDTDALESTESIALGLTSENNLVLGNITSTEVSITNVVFIDEVSFVASTYSVAEEAGEVVVQVQRVGNGVGAASVIVELGAVETASEGVDFTFTSVVTVNWSDGETGTKDISIPVSPDLLIEGDETFSLLLGTSPTNLNQASPVSTQVTITDVEPVDDVSFATTAYSTTEGNGSVVVQVQRVGSGVGAASVIVELGAVETASEGVDFTFASAVTVNWGAGETGTKDISIPILSDLLVEGDETFSLLLGASSTNLNQVSPVSTQVTITDVVPVDDVSFVATTYSMTEGGGSVVVQVQRVGNGIGAASAIVELAAEETASEGMDFIFGASVTVNWIDGEIGLKEINIPIIADITVEEAETFTLSINATSIGSNLGTNTSTQVTIVDGGITELDSIGFTSTTYRAAEETGFIDVGFLRTGTGVGLVEVNVSFVLVADEPGVGISPADSNDFSLPGDNVVTWLDGEVGIKTLTVSISPDSSGDADGDLDGEFFSLVLDPDSLVGGVQIKEAADSAGVVIFAKELLGNIVADDSPVKEVADAIDSVCSNVSSSDASALAECNKLSELDEAEIEQVLAIIQPRTVEAQIESAVALAGNQLQNLRKRLSELRGGRNQVSLAGLNMSLFDENVPLPAAMQSMLDASVGGAAGEGGLLDSPWGAFVNGTLSVGEQDDVDDSLGYDIRSKGITAGVDYRINRKMIVGVAVGFGGSDSDFNQNSGSQDSSSLTLTVFGNHFINNKIYADWIVSYTENDFDIKRKMDVLGSTHNISASPDGHQYSVAVGGGYDYVRGPLQVTGFGRIDYINTIIDSYEETGSFYALALSEQRDESLATAIGVKSAYVFNTKKAVFIPSLEIEWVHEYNQDARKIEAAFAQSPSSGSFSIETQQSDRDHMNAAFSVSAMFSGGKSGFFRYDTLLGEDDRTSESYTLGGRYEF